MTLALKIPRLCPAMHPKKVAMPRFENDEQSEKLTLTEAVLRVLKRALHSERPFAVFVIDGKLVLSSTNTALYHRMEKRWPDKLIGIYGSQIHVRHLIEDMSEHFSDEVSG